MSDESVREEFFKGLRGVERYRDGWRAYCPGHDDSDRSLIIGHAGLQTMRCKRGCSFDAILWGSARLMVERKKAARSGAAFGLRVMDATELIGGESPDQHASLPLLGKPGYIMEGWGHIVAGYPKAGKTELIASCASEWVRQGVQVLWLSEESEAVWRQRVALRREIPKGLRIVLALGADPEDLIDFASVAPEPVVVVDTIRNLLRISDENDNGTISAVLGQWEHRLKLKTRIYVHHMRKTEGDGGRAIAGGGAFLGAVDRALELNHDPASPKRRRLSVRSRIWESPELLYELTDMGLTALGDPKELGLAEVRRRVEAVLGPDWQTVTEVLGALGDPKPCKDQVRRALQELHESALAERDPEEDRPRSTYRYRRVPEICLPTDPVYT